MLSIFALSSSILFVLILAGAPLAIFTFYYKTESKIIEMPIFLAASVVAGFGISAFSASLAYSFLGINNYFYILLFITISFWSLIYVLREKLKFRIKKVNGFISFTLISTFIALYFSKSQWDSNLKPRILASIGPDVSQNLLASSIAQNLGNTWFDSSRNLIDSLGVNNLNQAAVKLFDIPSFVNLAGYDYLVFGVRWGLTVPFNQLIRLLGPQTVFLEICSILTVTLFATLIIGFAIFRVFNKTVFFSTLGAIALALNGAFINQYFNGGISQALGLIGNFGLLFILALVASDLNVKDIYVNKFGIVILSTFAWICSAISYVDSTLVVAALLTICTFILLIRMRSEGKKFVSYLILPGLLALVLNPIFVYSIYKLLNFRFKANLGTGINTGNWRMPTQNFGFFPSYTEFSDTQSIFIKVVSIIAFIILVFILTYATVAQPKVKSVMSYSLWTSILVTVFMFSLAVNSKNKSDYIYNKASTYIAPFFILSILILIDFKNNKLLNKISKSFYILASGIILISSLSIENAFANGRDFTVIMPTQYLNLAKNKEIKNYLESNNYILPYKAAYNYTGLLGVKYWISKAPNDYNLDIDSRIDKPLLLLCFVGDNICNPKTNVINHSLSTELSKYGIVEYESTISTSQYKNMTIADRYNYAFDVMGTERVIIPEKYMGGNPYLK
jgi:hypothetical protein